MEMKDRLHEQISNATSRLAKLQARQFLAAQRQATKDRAAVRRYDRLRRKRLAELVIAAGCDHLADAEILGALLQYRQGATAEERATAEAMGAAAQTKTAADVPDRQRSLLP